MELSQPPVALPMMTWASSWANAVRSTGASAQAVTDEAQGYDGRQHLRFCTRRVDEGEHRGEYADEAWKEHGECVERLEDTGSSHAMTLPNSGVSMRVFLPPLGNEAEQEKQGHRRIEETGAQGEVQHPAAQRYNDGEDEENDVYFSSGHAKNVAAQGIISTMEEATRDSFESAKLTTGEFNEP